MSHVDGQPELKAIIAELKEAIRSDVTGYDGTLAAGGDRDGLANGSSLGYLGRALRNLETHPPLAEYQFPARVPVVGGLIAWLQEQLGRLGAKWHTRNLLLQQNEINRLNLATLRATSAVLRDQVDTIAQLHAAVSIAERANAAADRATARVQELELMVERMAEQATMPVGPTTGDGVVGSSGFDYFRFELRFRGSPRLVQERQRAYLDVFRGASDVLDVGCGRGEFLTLLASEGISASGIDTEPQMVEYCRAHGQAVEQVDAVTHLNGLPDGSLGGVFMSQVVEHLPLSYLLRLLALCYRKLRVDAPIVIETPNPLCLSVFAHSFYQDPTHTKPVHPATLQFFLEQIGFAEIELRLNSEVPEPERLAIAPDVGDDAPPWLHVLDSNTRKLNNLLFGAQDYAVVARKFVWPERHLSESQATPVSA